MLFDISFLSLIGATLTFALMSGLYFRPFVQLLYYKRQEVVTKFYSKLTFMFTCQGDLYKKGDFYYDYKGLMKADPPETAVAENFFDKTRLVLLDPEMIKEFLNKYQDFDKDVSFVGLFHDLLDGSVVYTERTEWKGRRKMLSGARMRSTV